MMIKTEVKKSTKIDKGQYDLIKGDFSPEDAQDIINHLITKKINFHELRSFSKEIRLGEVDEFSLQRAKELKLSKKYINELIHYAKKQGKTLRVKSNISIELI